MPSCPTCGISNLQMCFLESWDAARTPGTGPQTGNARATVAAHSRTLKLRERRRPRGTQSLPGRRTIDILSRFADVMMGPNYTQRDTEDAATAIRKVYASIVRS